MPRSARPTVLRSVRPQAVPSNVIARPSLASFVNSKRGFATEADGAYWVSFLLLFPFGMFGNNTLQRNVADN